MPDSKVLEKGTGNMNSQNTASDAPPYPVGTVGTTTAHDRATGNTV